MGYPTPHVHIWGAHLGSRFGGPFWGVSVGLCMSFFKNPQLSVLGSFGFMGLGVVVVGAGGVGWVGWVGWGMGWGRGVWGFGGFRGFGGFGVFGGFWGYWGFDEFFMGMMYDVLMSD